MILRPTRPSTRPPDRPPNRRRPPAGAPSRSRPALAALPLAAAIAVAAPAAAQEVSERTSPGGIDFLHAPLPDADTVSIQVAWPSAWAYTEDAVATPFVGADLILAGGAGDRDAAEVQRASEELGLDGALNARPDHVYGALTVAVDRLDAALDIAAEALAEPALDERWFERIRDDFATNVAEAKRLTGTLVHDTAVRLVLGEGPLERTLTLEPASLAGDVALEDVARWHRTTFTRAGVTVAVAGGVDAARAGEAVDRLLGALPEGGAPAETPEVRADFAPRTVLLAEPGREISAVALLGRVPPTAEGGEIEDLVAALALGAGEGSRLYAALREKLRATYDVQAQLNAQTRELRALLLYTEVDPTKLDAAREALRVAYAAFLEAGPTKDEVAGARRRIAEGLARTFASPAPLARAALESALDGFGPERVAAMLEEEVEPVTPAGVKARLDAAWPDVDDLIEVVVSPDAGAIEGACAVESLDEVAACAAR